MCGTENSVRIPSNEDEGDNVVETLENNPPTPNNYTIWMCRECTFMNQTLSTR